MFTERIIIRVLDFVEIVLVKLTNKARKVRVLKCARKNGE